MYCPSTVLYYVDVGGVFFFLYTYSYSIILYIVYMMQTFRQVGNTVVVYVTYLPPFLKYIYYIPIENITVYTQTSLSLSLFLSLSLSLSLANFMVGGGGTGVGVIICILFRHAQCMIHIKLSHCMHVCTCISLLVLQLCAY